MKQALLYFIEDFMKIGCPQEVKNNEFRSDSPPNAVHAYVSAGYSVCVEKGAGLDSAITDDECKAAGATILNTAAKYDRLRKCWSR
jgi:alanine dehydrogenase